MTLSTFLFIYLLGGLTFIPLLLAAILVPAWRILPEVEDSSGEREGDEKTKDGEEKDRVSGATVGDKEDGAASGTFAVLRKYDVPAAIAALNVRHSNGHGGGPSSLDGTGEISNTSESVYQSMYRSVFDRNKNMAANTSIMESENASSSNASARTRKGATPVNIFYIVLRHGHLMLYESAAQIEVRHVISLAHHTISVSSGEGFLEADLKDGDFFIKRTAIVLTPTSTNDFPTGEAGGDLQSTASKRPFYLFSSTCIEKEDFYHALLSTRSNPPEPNPLDTDGIIKLQSILHSTNSLTPETRAINAIISRIFLALHHTDRLKNLIRNKIEKKISRVQKPAFIATLAVQSIDLGDSAPVVTNPRLKDLNITGDTTIAFDLRYTGGIKVTVSALAKLDLGARFKTRTADLLLSTSLTRLYGHVLVRIKPPPSNRLWFCFESMPEMEIKVEPVFQSKQITYTFILRAIEERIRSVVGETLVRPNWDDVSFFDTRGESTRGGIWLNNEEAVEEKPAGEVLKERNEKTRSMPSVIASAGIDGDSSAASSGSEAPSKLASTVPAAVKEVSSELKRRSVASLPAERESQTPPPLPPKPLRSPSLASPAASVASVQLDQSAANFEPVRSDSQSQIPQPKRWRIRTAPPQQTARKDAIETMREMRDRSVLDRETDDDHDSAALSEPAEIEDTELSSADHSVRQPKRAGTNLSAVTSSSSASIRSQRQQEAVQKGKNILAATAAATSAARTWSWNAIQTRAKASRGEAQKEPLGRGQPLPPPGVPLPGPQKGWLPSGVGVSGVKRKPVPPLPPRKGAVEMQPTDENTSEQDTGETVESENHGPDDGEAGDLAENIASPTSDDFGPWRENSGAGLEELEGDVSKESTDVEIIEDGRSESGGDDAIVWSEPDVSKESTSAGSDSEVVETPVIKRVPPPLPARPRALPDESVRDHAETSDTGKLPQSISKEDDTYTERLIAIPAPVQEHTNESDLEADGVQDIEPLKAPQGEPTEYIQTSDMDIKDEASIDTALRATAGEDAVHEL